MAVEIDIEYTGALRTRAVHGPSGSVIETSAPKDNEGDGSRFSPTDLCATALGTCTITVMAIAARKHGVDLAGARVHVIKEMTVEGRRRIARLPLTITLPPGVPVELRARLEEAARRCPVHESLRPEIDIEMRFEWGA